MGAPRTQATDKLGRRELALSFVVLWLLGFELAPNLHLGFHGELAAHSHRPAEPPDATHHAHGHGDRHHDEADHHHEADHHREDDTRREPAARGAIASTIDVDHGTHELLNRGIAALPPPPAMPRIAAAAFVQTIGVPAFSGLTLSPPAVQVRARGPPPCGPTRASPSAV